ncbi:hypothetical protein DW088_04745 [Butyricicoccus sp. AM05-1]|jgi:hypothetical protein|nr:hypothetical protein DW088_04745 [Butyricicoccus sp. AM05-1]RHT88916.1 hypothetical protein DW724_04935 [Butyricicoccus sp. AM27-36]
MKLSGAVRNHWANELPAAAGAANHPVVRTAPAPYPIVNNLMRICIAAIIFMIKIYISYNQSLVTNDTI